MHQLNKDTRVCISLSSVPSNFGTTLHNAGYQALGLNYIYKSFGIRELEGAIAGVRALGIRGCSVSMPFKEAVLPLLDEVESQASLMGAVNTIVNDNGRLTGYNTDVVGAQRSLEMLGTLASDDVLLLGAGGVSKAIAQALRNIGVSKIKVSNRDIDRIKPLNRIIECEAIPWDKRGPGSASVVINATSIGMGESERIAPIDSQSIEAARVVMDVVVTSKPTRLIELAREAGKTVAPGYLMSLEQAIEQFLLYTGRRAPREAMEGSLKTIIEADE